MSKRAIGLAGAAAAVAVGVAVGVRLRRGKPEPSAAQLREVAPAAVEEAALDVRATLGPASAGPGLLDRLRDVERLWRVLRWRFPEEADSILDAVRDAVDAVAGLFHRRHDAQGPATP